MLIPPPAVLEKRLSDFAQKITLMDFRFTNEFAPTKIDEIVGFLMGPRLWIPHGDYPDFLDWAQKVHVQLKSEAKRAIIALEHGQVVGAAVYQRHRKDADALELKNLTVRPDKRGRYLASFLVRNMEVEGATEFGSRHVVCDAKTGNLGIRLFLERQRYRVIGRDDLYAKGGGTDLVFRKDLRFQAVGATL